MDGSECDWGKVLAFEPPAGWSLPGSSTTQFEYDPDPAHASEVEVQVHPGGRPDRVNFEHRHIERLGADAGELAKRVDAGGGWPGILEKFADAAKAAA